MTAAAPRADPRDNIPRYLLPLRLAQLFLALVVLAFGAYGVATIATPGDVLIVTAVRSPFIPLALPSSSRPLAHLLVVSYPHPPGLTQHRQSSTP